MIKETEEPDMTYTDPDNSDKLMFTVRKHTILVSCHIDNTGNEWAIPLQEFKNMLTQREVKKNE